MNTLIQKMIQCITTKSDLHNTHYDGYEVLPGSKKINVSFYCEDCQYNFSKQIGYQSENIIPAFIDEIKKAAPPVSFSERKYGVDNVPNTA